MPPEPANQLLNQEEINTLIKEQNKAILIFEGKVYDATEFKETHPGGPKFIDDYIGKDITQEFYDAEHTKIALRRLNELKIGTYAQNNNELEVKPEVTNKQRMSEIDGEAWRDIIDPQIGTVYQIYKNLSREDYIKFINDPKHLTSKDNNYMRMFDNPILEFLSINNWYVVPMFWGPVMFYKLWQASHYLDIHEICMLFIAGYFLWSFFEYFIHRCVFHIETILPDHGLFLSLHYLIHGVHHAFPMQKSRLVSPPTLSLIYYIPMSWAVIYFTSAEMTLAIEPGATLAYMVYDLGHYYLHHYQPPQFLEYRKKYHMYHHYKDPDNGYGVTTSFWDKIFGTELDMTKKVNK